MILKNGVLASSLMSSLSSSLVLVKNLTTYGERDRNFTLVIYTFNWKFFAPLKLNMYLSGVTLDNALWSIL